MITLKFSQFFEGDFEDDGFELYHIRNERRESMYIGISRVSVWDRWFSGSMSHMIALGIREAKGNSTIGEVIERRFPASWEWMIELWTRDDCGKILENELGKRRSGDIPITDLEAMLIKKFQPLYNVMHASGLHEDPMISKALDEEFKEIFEN
jgi:hypothetical protein